MLCFKYPQHLKCNDTNVADGTHSTLIIFCTIAGQHDGMRG